jgi:ferrochelatase
VALDEFVQQKIDDILVIPLYPHYATSSTGSVNVEIMRALAKRWNTPAIKFIHSFYDYPPFIKAWIERASEYDWRAYDHVLFSYHGLPQRHIRKSDSCNHCFKEGCCDAVSAENKNCYAAHCHETTRLIVAELGIPKEKYSLSYQSRLGNDPWMPPYTSDVIKELAEAGKKRVLVFCPAFVSDCLETTVEISNEYQEEFEKYGGEKLELVKSLNDHPAWVGALKELVLENR